MYIPSIGHSASSPAFPLLFNLIMNNSSSRGGQASASITLLRCRAGKAHATAPWLSSQPLSSVALKIQMSVPTAFPLIWNASTIYWLFSFHSIKHPLSTRTPQSIFRPFATRNPWSLARASYQLCSGEHVLQDIVGHVSALLAAHGDNNIKV